MSLRARLTFVTVGLVAVGLLVANVVTYRALSASLLQRVDEQLRQAEPFAIEALRHGTGGGGGFPGQPGPFGDLGPPAGTYVALLDGNGTVIYDTTLDYHGDGEPPVPTLPAGLPGSAADGTGTVVFTARATSGNVPFRVQANGPIPSRGTVVIGIPLTEVRSTLARLIAIEAIVSLVVVALAAGLALLLVRLGLRPLDDMGRTAGAIAAGDLSQRVEPADDRTEVGRLGTSLNSMLAQIEAAFEERRASEARLRRFVADASHELRTPLTSIRGYAELFRRGASQRPEDLATSMARIEAEASRMGVLVDDLLLLARLDQGRPLEQLPVDVARIAADAVEGARAIEPDRAIDLKAAEPAVIDGDAGRIRQVFDNLLENARVHTPAGTPTRIEVHTDGEAVAITVADEGPGMEPQVADQAFERFYRGDPARARATGGAGLGLSIVAAIVEAHGGTVGVAARDGGATIEIQLPRTPPPATAPEV